MSHRLCIACLAVLASACGHDPTNIGVEPPPLLVREEGTYPSDLTEGLFDVDGLPIVVNFNREFTADEITLARFIPRPLSRGVPLIPSSNRRQMLIDGVVLDPFHQSYRLVIDGPAIPEPIVFKFYPRARPEADGAMEGRVTNGWTGRGAHGVIVYALPSRWREDRPQMRLGEFVLFDNPVLGVTTSVAPESGAGAMYRLTGLVVGVRYLVVAISDLNGDGVYDLTEDWSGYHRDFEHKPIELVAGLQATDAKEPAGPEMPAGVDIAVLPPGSLENPYSLLPDVLD